MRTLTLALFLVSVPALAQDEPRSGWTAELAIVNQAIYDPGFALFRGSNVVPSAEIRGRRDMDTGALRFSPEVAYAFAHPQRDLGVAVTEMWLSRVSLGARVSYARPALPQLRAFARAGGMGLHGTALVHDAYRDHRDEGFGAGAYASGGLELDAGVLVPGKNLHFALEAGHSYAPGMDFGRMGTLTIDGTFWSGSAAIRF